MASAAKTFRTVFEVAKNENANFFPGHMARGVKQMQRKLKDVDCIIEMHDARIPFAGRNPNFYHLLTAVRPRVLVLNKMDLADLRQRSRIETLLRDQMDDQHIIFTNCREQGDAGVKKIIPAVIDLIKSGDRFGRQDVMDYYAMVIGVPNVGKSSLINALRVLYMGKGNATKVGASPGVTRSVLEKIRISNDPTVFLLDTPGVLQPNIRNMEAAMKLALCANIDDTSVGIIRMADYLLFWLNLRQNFEYVEHLGLQEPSDDINEVLLMAATHLKKVKLIKNSDRTRLLHPDLDAAAFHFVRSFQQGKLGKAMLDDDHIKENYRKL